MDKKDEAFEDWKKGLKYKEIAKKYEVSLSAVKSWATRDWKQRGCNQAEAKVATSFKKTQPRGAPKGNKNAVGNKGGAPLGSQNSYKHGIYSRIYWDTLNDDERELIQEIDLSEEECLMDQIRLLTVRERRLMQEIEKHKEVREVAAGLAFESEVQRRMVTQGDLKIGSKQKQVETTTRSVSAFEIRMKLETELTRVQSKKTRCIEALNKIRMERQKEKGGKDENDLVEDWISSVLGGAEDE